MAAIKEKPVVGTRVEILDENTGKWISATVEDIDTIPKQALVRCDNSDAAERWTPLGNIKTEVSVMMQHISSDTFRSICAKGRQESHRCIPGPANFKPTHDHELSAMLLGWFDGNDYLSNQVLRRMREENIRLVGDSFLRTIELFAKELFCTWTIKGYLRLPVPRRQITKGLQRCYLLARDDVITVRHEITLSRAAILQNDPFLRCVRLEDGKTVLYEDIINMDCTVPETSVEDRVSFIETEVSALREDLANIRSEVTSATTLLSSLIESVKVKVFQAIAAISHIQPQRDDIPVSTTKTTITDQRIWMLTPAELPACISDESIDHTISNRTDSDPVALAKEKGAGFRHTLAKHLMANMFNLKETHGRNVNGRANNIQQAKMRLEPGKVANIFDVCFKLFPSSNVDGDKAKCVDSMNSYLRYLWSVRLARVVLPPCPE